MKDIGPMILLYDWISKGNVVGDSWVFQFFAIAAVFALLNNLQRMGSVSSAEVSADTALGARITGTASAVPGPPAVPAAASASAAAAGARGRHAAAAAAPLRCPRCPRSRSRRGAPTGGRQHRRRHPRLATQRHPEGAMGVAGVHMGVRARLDVIVRDIA